MDVAAEPELCRQFAHVGEARGKGRRAELMDLLSPGPHAAPAGAAVAQAWRQLHVAVTGHIADGVRAVRVVLGPDATAEIDGAELLRRVAAGQAVVLDVLPQAEFVAGHAPGAVSIPIDELADRRGGIPTGQETVARCRDALRGTSRAADRRAVRLGDDTRERRPSGHAVAPGAGR